MKYRLSRPSCALALVALVVLGAIPALGVDATPEQAATYQRLADGVSRDALRAHVEYLAGLGSRLTGTPGCDKAADYVRSQFSKIGLRNIRTERFPITIPEVVRDKVDSRLTVEGEGVGMTLYPLWPNSVRTSKLPPEGVTGPLVWGGSADLSDLDGKPLGGSIVMVDFRCGSRWLNAARLGARAIIFMEPDEPALRGEAESKYLSVPVNIPRFWIGRRDGQRLLARLEARAEVTVKLTCDMVWRQATGQNILAEIPGTDPVLRKQRVFITAYYDSMSIVPELAPGGEAACGIAAMIELAKLLKADPPKRTVVFLAMAGHFEALSGIRSYLSQHLDRMETGVMRTRRAKFLGLIPYTQHYRDKEQIHLLTALDLSSRTSRVGIFYKGWYYDFREDIQRDFSTLGRVFRENGERIANWMGQVPDDTCADGINPISGKPWRTFIPGKVALDNEPFTLGGGQGVAFVTTDDTRAMLDTPFDRPDNVDFRNLASQVTFLACSYHDLLNDAKAPITEQPVFKKMTLSGGFALLTGQAVYFDPRKGVIPNSPVPGSLVTVRPGEGALSAGKIVRQAYMGVRGDMPQLVDEHGEFKFDGVPTVNAYGYRKGVFVDAYRLDPQTGDIDYAPDLGVDGNKAYSIEAVMTMGRKRVTIVVFPCDSVTIYDIVDPVNLLTLPEINVYNGQTDAEPRSYGYAISRPERWVSHVADVGLLFAEPGAKIKVTMGLGPGAPRLLLLNSDPKRPFGQGFVVQGDSVIANTPLQVAKDMWLLDDSRIKTLKKYRIVNQNLDNMHAKGAAYIKAAEAALSRYDYSSFDGAARAAWAYESRAYPEVQATTDDVVKGVLFYLALMLPFAFFLERLIFAFPNLKLQIVGTVGIFAAIFLIFRYIHPAFDITMNPLVILLAFIMLALSILVISLVASKFENQLKALQTQMSGVHRADIGRMSVAFAAFSLGISNMRKRRARTFLTCVTLILLTFTVLSFTSVVSETRFNDRYSPGVPRYNGLMIRNAVWAPLEESAYRLLNDEFGGRPRPADAPKTEWSHGGRVVVARAWYSPAVEGQEEQSFIKLTCNKSDKAYNVRSAIGLGWGEQYVTKPQTALRWGRWFNPSDRYACIIPTAVAQTFNIRPQDVGKTKVQFAGMPMTLVGVVDTYKFRTLTDLDKEPLSPVDFIQMQKMQRSGQQQGQAAGFQEYLHLSPDDCIIVPYELSLNLGAKVQSVAIDFVTPAEVKTVLADLMPRLGYNLYAGMGDLSGENPKDPPRIRRFSSISATSVSGMLDLVVPILIAALIVLNTMLGSVYERVKEIGIFSSIGLAPSHIGLLFLAEAFVFAILGAIFGYLIGQGTAKIITVFDVLPGLYLNYSSLSAVASTGVVIATVLLSTMYPARKASEVATPAIERRWKVPDPVGDDWTITMPFAVTGEQASALNAFMSEWFHAYEEYSIGDFVTQNVQSSDIVTDLGKGYSLQLMTWLAPFDLGVSQKTELRTAPTDMEDVYEILLILHRESGDVSSWKRVNRRFLNTLRKQFLIWRTLAAEDRERYLTGATTRPATA